MVVTGARRVRFAVERPVMTLLQLTLTFALNVLPALVLGAIALWVHEQKVESELLVRRREFVTKFIAFYAALKMCQGIASGYLRRTTREGIYFALMVLWFVMQSLYLYEWHHLDDDLPETKPD